MTAQQNLTREPRDTSPLELEQLSDDELATILYIERRLYEAQGSTAEKEPAKSVKHYLAPAQVRHPRVLLMDGGRGTGKTSMLLTLVHRWAPENETGIPRHDADAEAYRQRIERVRSVSTFIPGDYDFDIPTHVSVVGRILDFDPLPPEMPLIAGIIQAWQPLAEHYDELSGRLVECDDDGETLMDLWHRLFRVAAVGWAAIPQNRGLIEQVLDRQEQVADWQRLDERWREFVDEVIKRGKSLPGPHKLAPKPIFVIMIDDLDLQVGRIRELLPALRLLYHSAVVFLVAADHRLMIDILNLDFLGQQRRLTSCELHEKVLKVGDPERWASELARSSFQKVFPLSNRWPLRQLSLRELLEFPDATTNLRTVLNTWPQQRPEPGKMPVGDYLYAMGVAAEDVVDLPPLMTYRTVHQVFQQASSQHASDSKALGVMRQIMDASASDDLIRIMEGSGHGPAIEYRLIGELTALFRPDLVEPISGQADIVMSAHPDFVYRRDPSSLGIRMTASSENAINFTSALTAVTLREDGYSVAASGLRWDARLTLAWTRVRILNRDQEDPYLDLAFQWRFHEHPSPMRLLLWTKDWGKFVRGLHVTSEQRLDRIVYAWIYYQLLWLGAPMDGVLDPFGQTFNTEDSWSILLDRSPEAKSQAEAVRWKTQTLPLLARPEVGLDKKVQNRLLKPVRDSSDSELAVFLWDQRRRLVTDAILAAADEVALSAKSAEDLEQVERAIRVFERRHRDAQGGDSPWWTVVEERAQATRNPDLESASSKP